MLARHRQGTARRRPAVRRCHRVPGWVRSGAAELTPNLVLTQPTDPYTRPVYVPPERASFRLGDSLDFDEWV